MHTRCITVYPIILANDRKCVRYDDSASTVSSVNRPRSVKCTRGPPSLIPLIPISYTKVAKTQVQKSVQVRLQASMTATACGISIQTVGWNSHQEDYLLFHSFKLKSAFGVSRSLLFISVSFLAVVFYG